MGAADRLPSAVLAHVLSFLDDWRAIGRSAVSRTWAAPLREDRVWRRALENRWARLDEINPWALGEYWQTGKALDACIALGGCWAAPRLTDRRVLLARGSWPNRFACSFVLASTAPTRPVDLLQGNGPVDFVRRVLRENSIHFFGYGFWPRESDEFERQRARVYACKTKTRKLLEDIAHDLTINGANFSRARGPDDARAFPRRHIRTRQLRYLLGGAALRATAGLDDQAAIISALADVIENWEIVYEEEAGSGLVDWYGGTNQTWSPDDLHDPRSHYAHFFAGWHEVQVAPVGDGHAIFAFEHDPGRPNKLVSVAVYASETNYNDLIY